jgi:dTMP kinase
LELTAEAELLLFLASRSQLVDRIIRPALESGETVICDRFGGSTLAYQGYGRGLDVGEVGRLVDFSTRGLVPDLTLPLSVPVSMGLNRKKSEADHSRHLLQPTMFDTTRYDRFHDEETAFHERVRQGYLKLAGKGEGNWVVIDGTPGPEQVFSKVWQTVESLLAG